MYEEVSSPAVATITVVDPRDESPIVSLPVATPEEISAIVDRARGASMWWRALGYRARAKHLGSWRAVIAHGASELADVISRETGKSHDDALLEVMLTLGHLEWAAKNAHRVLRRRKVPSGLASYNQHATLGYEPHGVIGVIGPWNYPLYTPMGSISYALAAGNAVVFKPSELTPGTALWLADAWAQVSARPVVQVVVGDGSTGAALIDAGVDKVAFTGSTTTAKRVMAQCALSLTPLVAECGGKDAMIVAADADLDSAADFAVFGAFGNAGQTCVGVERIYVERAVRDDFVRRVDERMRRIGADGWDKVYGPLTLAAQGEVIAAHVADALANGGTVLAGSVHADGRRVDPVVLGEVDEHSRAVQEETFGPTVVVNVVDSLDDAVARANATPYGLGAAVFTRDRHQGEALAAQLRAGVVTINSVLGFASVGALSFGGVKGSGFGRIHGADGLREFSVPKSIARQTSGGMMKLLTLERRPKDMELVRKLIPMLHGRG